MRIATWNVNGLRAAARKGFLDWLDRERPDVVCLQETRGRPEELEAAVPFPSGYRALWHPAERPGYSGVLTLTRIEPREVKRGLGVGEIDREGRVLLTELDGVVLVNAYFPNSQRDHARLDFKLRFCAAMLRRLNRLRREGRRVILCGDFNIAHRPIDLRHPERNEDNAGFLPEERAWMDRLLGHGWVDGFRRFCQEPGHYTWWSYRKGVRERNIGWRIDYFVTDERTAERLAAVRHQPEVPGSDHCPVLLELNPPKARRRG